MKDHFENKTFWFIAGSTFLVLAYVAAVTFFPIPKENQRFVDIALAFLLGFISANASYLTGGTPTTAKKPAGPGTTAEINASITTTPNEQDNNP